MERGIDLTGPRAAGRAWGERPVKDRLRVIKAARRLIAAECESLAALLADRRPVAETLVSEVLPLADAARFLERNAARLLAPRMLRRGRPLWLLGVRSDILREPLGVVLVLAPSNYPLFLPGAQVLQALAAGNAVGVKPALGCAGPMLALADMLRRAGLPDGVFVVLDSTAETGAAAVRAGFDKIVLTGSATTGRHVLRAAAETLTPATMELSGCDAVFVLPGADIGLVAACLAYGLRLNGGQTCIAPRRVFTTDADALRTALLPLIAGLKPVPVPNGAQLTALLQEAEAAGATVSAWPTEAGVPPVVVAHASPGMRLLTRDVFAPVVSIVQVADMTLALAADEACPYALGASVFGPTNAARAFAARVRAGSVVVNDVIVPTADPRLPFGGRGESGFGVTRGAEGLLEMTAIKTVSTRRGWFRPHLDVPKPSDAKRFASMIRLLHGR